MVTDPPTQINVLALCRDRRSFVHYWSADERHRVPKNRRRRPRYSRDVPKIFRKFHPEVDLTALTQVPATVSTPA